MRINKKLIILTHLCLIIFTFVSCGVVREGFTNQKKNSSDEFLVEKKSPLVLPPDYDELPKPGKQEKKLSKQNNIKELISKNEKNKDENLNSENLEGSILNKIKKD